MAIDIDVKIKGDDEALKAIDKLNEGEKERQANFEKTNQQFEKNVRTVEQLRGRLGGLARARNKAFDKKKIKEFDKQIEQTKKQIQDLTNEGLKPANKELGFLNKLAKDTGVVIATAFAVSQAIDLAQNIAQLTLEVQKFNNTLEQTTGLQGAELDALSAKIRGLSTTFQKDYNDVLLAQNNLTKQFGITQTEAFDLIEKGFVKGADASGDFLRKIEEYGIQFKNAGLSAEDFVKFATQEIRGGVFDDKLLDSVKEINLRLRELTPATIAALKPLGSAFSNQLIAQIKKGEISTIDAFQKIANQAKILNLSVDETQTLIADLGGGPVEDLGGLEEAIKQITAAQNLNLEAVTDFEKQQEKRLAVDKEVAEVQGRLAKALSSVTNDTEILFKQVQVLLLEGLVGFINALKAIPEFVDDNKEAIILLGASLALLNAQYIASTAAQIKEIAVKKAYTIATRAQAVATRAQAVATRLLNTVLKANPLALITAGVAGLVALYSAWSRSTQDVTDKQEELFVVDNKVSKQLEKDKAILTSTLKAVQSYNVGTKERTDKIKELQKEYPEFLNNLDAETASNQELQEALKLVTKEYDNKIKIQAASERIDAITKRQIEIQKELFALEGLAPKNNEEFLKGEAKRLQERNKIRTQDNAALEEFSNAQVKLGDDLTEALIGAEKSKQQRLQEEFEKAIAKRNELFKELGIDQEESGTGGFNQEAIDAEIKSHDELAKFQIQKALELNKLRQDEIDDIAERARLIRQEQQLRMDLANLEKNILLRSANTASQVQLISQKNAFELEKIAIETNRKLEELNLDKVDAVKFNEERLNDEIKMGRDKLLEDTLKNLDKEVEEREKANEKILEDERLKQEQIKAITQELFAFGQSFLDQQFENNQQRIADELTALQAQKEEELRLAGDNENKKALIEFKFAEKERQLKQRQAQAEKDKAIFDLFVQTAINTVRAIGTPPVPNFVLAGIVGAIGAAQTVAVASRPVPKFASGSDRVRRLNGEPSGVDTIFAKINENEGIIPSKNNMALLKTGIGATHPRLPELVGLGLAFENGTGKNTGLTKKDLEGAFGNALQKQPLTVNNWDRNGIKTWVVSGRSKFKSNNADNSF